MWFAGYLNKHGMFRGKRGKKKLACPKMAHCLSWARMPTGGMYHFAKLGYKRACCFARYGVRWVKLYTKYSQAVIYMGGHRYICLERVVKHLTCYISKAASYYGRLFLFMAIAACIFAGRTDWLITYCSKWF